MENRKDVNHVIAGLDGGLMYGSLVGQMPGLHGWLLGNPTMRTILGKLTEGSGDPIPTITKVSLAFFFYFRRHFSKRPRSIPTSGGRAF
jgi:hypothetical protein